MLHGKHIQIISKFLLTVYIMMLTAGAFHVHERVEDDFVCADCINHVSHPGHFSENTHGLDDCAICKILSTSYTAAQTAIAAFSVTYFFIETPKQPRKALCKRLRASLLRAPPIFG